MKEKTAELLVEAINQVCIFDEDEARVKENYSGRGMYGKETTGIVCDDMSQVIQGMAYLLEQAIGNDDEELQELAEDLQEHRINSDSLGLSMVFY